jgi:Secretion system C-terminal sorting domain
MKKILLLSLCALLSLNAYCQFTMTSSNLPTVGSSFTLSLLDTTGAVPGPAGAGQVWDFSSDTVNSTSTISYVSPTGQPGASNFPSATLATQSAGTYIYYLANSSEYTTLGTYSSGGGYTTILNYTDSEINFNLPFNYSTTQHDVFSGITTSSASPYPVYRTGNDTASADAYGIVKCPNGLTYSVTRVKTVQNFHDSTDYGGFPVLQDTRIETYNYFQQNISYPIIALSLSTSTTDFFGSTTTAKLKSLTFYGGGTPTNINSNMISAGTKIYPNPASDQLNIELPDNNTYSLELKDMSGKSILSSSNGGIIISGNKASSDLRGLSKGIYVLEINSNGQSGVKKIIIE